MRQIINVTVLIIIVEYTTEDDIYKDSFCYLSIMPKSAVMMDLKIITVDNETYFNIKF
ncbi:hypothetical protein J2T56_000370 [Natronobacillus azotifigens]|uniref:Uncharacterized protein n=1 Tax=Natronobacillus azotifigens TaxID=472978 RepID=A0A9J6R8G4_9BACI|nr:hypothetical protein [Natronobacillus azotifigens]MCZ0701855.1 hypothetical protein [Natronobacillus azotifigens]